MLIDIILFLSSRLTFTPRYPTAFILPNPTELLLIMEVKDMNNPVDPRKIPGFIERLAKAGHLLDVVCSKREIRITYNRSASKYTTIPFGQTRLTDFQGSDLHGQNCSKLSHVA
jgi:hypothetical protein